MKLRLVAFVVVLTLLGLGGLRAPASAQQGGDDGGVGTAVPVVGTEGGEIARITVTEVEDPFEDYDPSAGPERSYHYVLLHLDVENTGNRPYTFNAYGVTLQDADGFLYQQTYIFRTEEQLAADPEFTGEEIEAGDTVSGVVGFQVLNGAELVRVVFQPDYDRLIFLADLTVEGAAPPPDDPDDAAATPAVSGDDQDADTDDADTADTGDTGADDADADADAAALDLSDAECDDIQAWIDDVTPSLEVLEETLDAILAEDPIAPDTLTDIAADLEDAAGSIRDSDPPAVLEEAATALADALDAYAAAYGDAAEAGDDIPLEDLTSVADTAEAEALLDDATTLSDPALAACGIDV